LINHVTPLPLGYRYRISRRNGKGRRLYPNVSMVIMGSDKTNRKGTRRMMLLWDSAGRKSPRIRQVKNAHTSPRAVYREGFGWRFI
jgi:hypothetical protein